MKAIILTILTVIILLSMLISIAYVIVSYEKIAILILSAIALFIFSGIVYSTIKDALE